MIPISTIFMRNDTCFCDKIKLQKYDTYFYDTFSRITNPLKFKIHQTFNELFSFDTLFCDF